MANNHFGEIGDVWKHLPLAEILAQERPVRYWESHAGSATYPLSRSWQREYGIYRILDRAVVTPALAASQYVSLLATLPHGDGYPTLYPGSATLAMRLLGPSVSEYVLCDLDPQSITSLEHEARAVGLTDRVQCIQEDGIAILWERMASLTPAQAAMTLIHIDPFEPHDTSRRSGRSTVDLCFALAGRGCMVVYWYAVMRPEDRGWAGHLIAPRVAGQVRSLWAGEIALTALRGSDLPPNPGVLGCGVLCANLSEPVIRACTALGDALAMTYRAASLPQGRSGALEFVAQRLDWPSGKNAGR